MMDAELCVGFVVYIAPQADETQYIFCCCLLSRRRSSKPKSPVVESSKQSCISSLTVESSDLSGNISLRVW